VGHFHSLFSHNLATDVDYAFTGRPEIKDLIIKENGCLEVHDFRLWTLDGINHVASMHVVVKNNMDLKEAERLKEKIKSQLKHLHILHATIEVEFNPEHEI